MTRITTRDLAGMLERLDAACKTAGIITSTDRLGLAPGSKLNGNSYEVWTFSYEVGHRDHMTFGTFHFGFTARDCYDRMHAMCVALEMAARS